MNQLPAETEAEFQEAVIQIAQLQGWKAAHFRAARTAKGWRTAVAADGAGFPDLVMVRNETLIFVELKSAGGRVSPLQKDWLAALTNVGLETPNVIIKTWRPRDWPAIERILQ